MIIKLITITINYINYINYIKYTEPSITILLTKTTAARNGVALSYHSVRGLYFLAVVFAATVGVTFLKIVFSFILQPDYNMPKVG